LVMMGNSAMLAAMADLEGRDAQVLDEAVY
jgi:hypothetical protein